MGVIAEGTKCNGGRNGLNIRLTAKRSPWRSPRKRILTRTKWNENRVERRDGRSDRRDWTS